MEATAKATYVRIAPRKVKIVLDLIRNKPCDENQGTFMVHAKGVIEAICSSTNEQIRADFHGFVNCI